MYLGIEPPNGESAGRGNPPRGTPSDGRGNFCFEGEAYHASPVVAKLSEMSFPRPGYFLDSGSSLCCGTVSTVLTEPKFRRVPRAAGAGTTYPIPVGVTRTAYFDEGAGYDDST